MNKAQIILKKGKYESLQRRHPWVFSGAIKEIYGNPEEGDVVDVLGAKGEYFGAGHFQKGSIAVRMLTFNREAVNQAFYLKRIQSALEFRQKLGFGFDEAGYGNTWRLVYGEADLMPGLIIDWYNGVAVIQAHSIGFHRFVNEIAELLAELLDTHLIAVFYKLKDTLDLADEEITKSELLWGTIPEDLIVTENGLQFHIDVQKGQKTGFFLDQRENRKIVGNFSGNRSVLNMFCYTGGFSVAALQGGATIVHSVDASASAVDMAGKNIKLNGYSPELHQCIIADAFEYLEQAEPVYDMIILDPPAYAKHTDARHRAVKGYQRLNLLAFNMIRPGGLIFTFSCSQVVDKRLFESTVMSAAIISGRHVRVVQELSHAACHAHAITHPEGKYLKGLMLHVE
jgi:23S rRNA (cytosine1962-C5)-methyltransferase